MGWTKQELIDEAFGELALQGFTFNLDADVMQSALRRLDSLMATWNGKGIRIGYALPSSPSSSELDSDSGLPDWATEGVFLALAVRLSATMGKSLSPSTMSSAKAAYDVITARCAFPMQQQLPSNLPLGSGNKPWRNTLQPFFPVPTDPLVTADGDSAIDFN